MTPVAPVPRDTDLALPGPAPHVVYLQADSSGRVDVQVDRVQKVKQTRTVVTVVNGREAVRVISEQVDQLLPALLSLEDIKATYTTADGLALTTEAVRRKAKDGLVVVLSADGKPVDKAWLRTLDPGVVVAASEVLVGPGGPRPTAWVSAQAPRLVRLGTGADGNAQLAYNPKPDAEMRGLVDVAGKPTPVIREANGGASRANARPAPTIGTPPVKPLADVKFDAYDLSGKLVGREAALKRLAAGGLVVVAGENRPPDPHYLKAFRGDLLVLVSPELVNVPIPAGGNVKPVRLPAAQGP